MSESITASSVPTELPVATQLEVLVTQVIKHASDENVLSDLSVKFAELQKTNPTEVEQAATAIQNKFDSVNFVYSLTLLMVAVLVGILRQVISVKQLNSDWYFPLKFLLNNSANVVFSIFPAFIVTQLDEFRLSQLRTTFKDQESELADKLMLIIDILSYLSPIILMALFFVYNVDIETAQRLPTLPSVRFMETNQPGTADLLDLPAGLFGLVLGYSYIQTLRKKRGLRYLRKSDHYQAEIVDENDQELSGV